MASEQQHPPEGEATAPVAWAETPPLKVLGQRDQPAPDAPSIFGLFPRL